jgi:hypothetical protein
MYEYLPWEVAKMRALKAVGRFLLAILVVLAFSVPYILIRFGGEALLRLFK